MRNRLFADRVDAGRQLGRRLEPLRGSEVVVVGLPRGGVVVAAEVARALGAPLDVIVVRKLGVPYQPELAMGAVGENGVRIINLRVLQAARVTDAELAAVEARERAELERRARRFRGDRPRVPLAGRTVVVVDDGIATGSTAKAACQVARAHGAGHVVLAVPVAPGDAAATIGRDADEVVCLETPRDFYAIGQWYGDFTQVGDDEVVGLLGLHDTTEEPAEAASPAQRRRDIGEVGVWRDPLVERAREEADGLELFEDPFADRAVLAEREEAQGVELFADPDAVVPARALQEDTDGHETLVAEQAGLEPDDDETRAPSDEESWEY